MLLLICLIYYKLDWIISRIYTVYKLIKKSKNSFIYKNKPDSKEPGCFYGILSCIMTCDKQIS